MFDKQLDFGSWQRGILSYKEDATTEDLRGIISSTILLQDSYKIKGENRAYL